MPKLRKALMLVVPLALIVAVAVIIARPADEASFASAPLAISGTQQTNFQVVNKASADATVEIRYYDATGAEVTAAMTTTTIAANSSKMFYQSKDGTLGSTFNGSAVVSSNQPVEVVVGEVVGSSSIPYKMSAHGGVKDTATSTSWLMPLVRCQYSSGWSTRVAVQNASGSSATVYMTIYNPDGSVKYPANATVAANASKKWDHGDLVASLGAGFQGSAIITSTAPLAVVIDEYNNNINKISSYDAIPSSVAGTTFYGPLVAKGYSSGWYTNFQLQNLTAASVNVEIVYQGYANSGTTPTGPLLVVTDTFSIAANGSANKLANSVAALPATFKGTAKITSSGNIVGRAEWANANTPAAGGYNLFAGGNTETVLPLLYKKFSAGWYTGVHIMNLGASDATVAITYTGKQATSVDDPGTPVGPVTQNVTVAKTMSVYQGAFASLPEGFIGSASITSSQPIAVVVEENCSNCAAYPGADVLLMYEGFPKN